MSKQDYEDDLLGKGKGDPDIYGYPKPTNVKYIGEDKAVVERHYPITGRGDGYPWSEDQIDYDPRMDEDQESED